MPDLNYYRFLSQNARTELEICTAKGKLLDELRFWNDLAREYIDVDRAECNAYLGIVGRVLKECFDC